MTRKGQTKPCRAYLIANPNFVGDSVPISEKFSRGEADGELRRRLTDGEYRAYDSTGDVVVPKAVARKVTGTAEHPVEILD